MVIKRYGIGIAFVLLMGVVLPVTAAQPNVNIKAPSLNDTPINGNFTFIANVISINENLNSAYFNISNSTGTNVNSSVNLVSTSFNTSSSGHDFNYVVNTQILGGDGNYSLEVTATNNGTSPNSSTATRTFIVSNNITTMPPSNVTSLTSTAGMNFINWTWVDPIDTNFEKVKIYIDGIFKTFVNKGIRYYNETFSPNSTHTIAVYSVSSTGNVNTTNPSNNTNTTLPNTPTGQVTLTFSNLQISFSNVTTAGNTSVSTSSTPPADFGSLFTAIGFYYTITTTASFSENVTIGLTYTGLIPIGYSANDVHLYHYKTSWVDITTTRDSAKVYGNVTGFSTFVLGVQPKPAIIKDNPPDTNFVTTGSQPVAFQAHSDQIANINWSIDNGSPFNNGSMAAGQISKYTPTPSIGSHNVSVTATNTTTGMSNTTYWNWTVRSKTYLQGNRIWDGSKPDLFSLKYTWNPMSFPGFYYDMKSDVGNENIIITLNGYNDRNIRKGNIVYSTTPEEVNFGYSSFGSYQVIGFMADKYFAGFSQNTTIIKARPSVNFADKNALGQGQLHRVLMDDGDQRTVSVGGTLTLKNGYVLKATDIDSTARTMLISLLKDGSEVDTTPLSAGETYVYTKKVGAVSDLPILIVRFDNVFSGREVQAAFLKGIFQIDETPTKIKTGDTYGVMEVTSVSKDEIKMTNKNAVDLGAGSTRDIMGDLKLVVADNSSVIRYALSVEKTGNFEVRSSVYRDDDPNKVTEWTPYNFGMNIGKTSIGFYYSLDDGIGNESLRLTSSPSSSSRTIGDQGLVYTTTPQDVSFERSEFGSYQVIGFKAEKYFAGYKNTIANTRPSVNFADKNALGQGQLHKVLTDDNDQRTISVGGTLTLKEGYVLKATDIDTTARIMLISLLKDGSEVDTTPLSAGETYVYTKKVGAVQDLPIIMARFDNVFSGREVQAAFLKGIFQISETPTTIKNGDKFDRMEVTSVGKDMIEMKNDGSISLNQNSVETLMGSVKLKVADNSDKLRFYFAVDVTPEMVANQLVIDAPSKITAGDVAIVKVTAGGAGVDGASVVLGSTDMGQTDSTGAVNYTLPKTLKGMYNITATKLGYQGATKSIEILQYVEYRLSMDAPAKANQFETIPIKITYNGTAIPGATVKFDNTTIGTTDSSGVLNYKLDTSGMHTLTASKSGYITIAREIEVRAPYSEYRAIDISIAPNSTFTNREVLIRSNITNAGTKGDTLPVELKVNNSVVDNRTVTLAPGEKQEINFTLKEAKPGNYTVEILGQKGILEVKEAPLNYLLIGGIITGLGAIIIYVLTAKGKITLGDLKSKLDVDALKSLLSKSGKKGL